MMKLIWAWQCLSKDRHLMSRLRASALAMASYSRMIGTFGDAEERRHRSAKAAPDWRPRHIRAIMHIADKVSYDRLNSCSGASKV